MGMQSPVSTGRPATAPLAEHKAWSVPGVLALVPGLVALVVGIGLLISALTSSAGSNAAGGWAAILLLVAGLLLSGLVPVVAGEARVVQLFGSYQGTVRAAGLAFVNPFTRRRRVSVRIRNHETAMAKVNDADGNPIEIAAVVVWQVADTAKALYAVDEFPTFVAIQTETAVRHIASSYPYTSHGDIGLSLRDNADEITSELSAEIADRVAPAGVTIIESRLTRLSYAAEIAQAMLRQQQANAVVGARRRIVEGAVGMVQLALQRLKD
ncbi:MAG TPA: SPFH domain-containing protein, partial [Streptosporangiaceae bacterium]|nr:SPFH domain-containing protein [Streptosporangiaceae bacterium]